MGSMVRLILGVLLILNSSQFLETVDTNHTRDESKEKSIVETSTENLTKPKTDNGTEKPIDRRNNLVTDNKDKIKPIKETVIRENAGRLMNADRYTSEDFHNKVYTQPISPDNEKFVIPETDYDQHHSADHLDDFHVFDADLTTPQTALFDSRYKEAVKTVDQTLEQIDSSSTSIESSSGQSDDSKESLDLEKLYNDTQRGDGKAKLNYINYRTIEANDTNNGKNSVHSDVVDEAGSNLDFQSAYNETKIIDEKNEPEVVNATDKTFLTPASLETVEITATTPTSNKITKPKFSRNNSHISILNNNIEADSSNLKSIEITTKTAKAINSRGTVKFLDYAITTPISLIRYATSTTVTSTTNQDGIEEPLVQENHVIPVQVQAPSNIHNTVVATDITTTESSSSESTITVIDKTSTAATTEENTTAEPTSTIPISTTEAAPEVTTFIVETTTEDDATSTVDSSTPSTEESTITVETATQLSEETTTYVDTTTTTIDEFTVGNTTTFVEENLTEVVPIETTYSSVRTSKGFAFNSNSTTQKSDDLSQIATISTTLKISGAALSTSTTEPDIVQIGDTSVDYDDNDSEDDDNYQNKKSSSNNVSSTTNTPELIYHDINYTTLDADAFNDDSTTNSDLTSITTDGSTSGDNSGTIAAIAISAIGAVCLIILAGLLFIMKKRQKRFNYGQRCRPVNLDDYSMDNVSVYNSVRRKPTVRSSKRSYGNPAFDDPASVSHPLNLLALKNFAVNKDEITAEFEEIPQITAKTTELPDGCDTKNRYANVIPLPETRVFLKFIDGYPNSDYINANYVTGPKNTRGYYIACQAPMQSTVDDFWRMIWEQETKLILMLTHLFENGVEKCVDYLPPSEVLDCHRLFGDFQITLKKRDVKEKYVISILQLKNMVSNSWREVTHFWYLGWPEKGVPLEANSLIAFLIEARSYMKSSTIDRHNVAAMTNGNKSKNEINPVVVHCSPGTGRTGVMIACDIGIREFEQTRLVDIPRIVYKIRRNRAGAIQTRDQYAFIYKVISVYATKLTEVS